MNNTNFDHISSLNCLILNIINYYIDKNIDFQGNLDKNFIYNLLSMNNNIPSTFDLISDQLSFDYQFKYFRNNNDTECMISTNDNDIYVSFNSFQTQYPDILSDLKQLLNYTPVNITNTDFIVQNNFYDIFFVNNFLEKIIDTVLLFNHNNNKNIIITGYSLGAPYAFIFSYLFNLSFPQQKIYIQTFGSIKFCNENFFNFIYNNFNFNIYNSFNKNDIVPILPFEPFVNTKNKIFIINNKQIECLENYNFNIFNNNSIYDHLFKPYFDNITSNYLKLN